MVIREYVLLNNKVFLHISKTIPFKHIHSSILHRYRGHSTSYSSASPNAVYTYMRAYENLLLESI